MKVNCQVEAIVCIDSFKTIDLLLLQEGMYQLRVSLYFQDEQQGIKAPLIPKETFQTTTQSLPRTSFRQKQQIPIPANQTVNREVKQKASSQKMKDWVPAHILKDYNMFCTQAFLIRTWTEEEKIQIQNGCRFTAQFPYQYSKMPMFLEMELMYNDLTNQNQQLAQFKCIALAKFRVNEICQGVFEYIPVIFSDEHFHLVNMCLYCSITEFKFQIPKSSQQQKEDPIMSMGSQILSSKLNLKQQIRQLKELYNTFIQPLRIAYQALSDFYAQLDMEIAYQERRNSTGGGFQVQKSFSQLPVSCYKDLDRQIELSVDKRRSPNNSGSLDSDEQHILHQSKTIAIEYQQVQSMLQQLWQKVQQLIKQKNYHFLRILKVQSLTHQQQRYTQQQL